MALTGESAAVGRPRYSRRGVGDWPTRARSLRDRPFCLLPARLLVGAGHNDGVTAAQPNPFPLRLVRPIEDRSHSASRVVPTAVVEVERENHSAAGLDPAAMREAFGAGVAAALDGGSAAILTPERRRRLVDIAERLGIRPFDANLVIAVVQDRVRRGEDWREGVKRTAGGVVSRDVIDQVVREVEQSATPQEMGMAPAQLWLGVSLGLALASALIAWTLGAW